MFDINVLGCGSAIPTTWHMASSQVVDLRDKLYMIDCGEGTQVQMRKNKIKFSRVNHIFISHFHGDQCFGLTGLISTFGLLGRTGDLFLHGHKDLETYLTPLLKLFCDRLPYKVCFNHIDTTRSDLVMEDRSLKVTSIPLRHRIPCCGYLFEEKETAAHIIKDMTDFYKVPLYQLQAIREGADFITPEGEVISNNRLVRPAEPARKYAYCSDTLFTPAIVPIIEGVDLLYHEATFNEEDASRAKVTYHSTAKQAAEIAKAAKVKQLMIGHYSARYEDLTTMKEEAASVFPNVILANEGLKISLK